MKRPTTSGLVLAALLAAFLTAVPAAADIAKGGSAWSVQAAEGNADFGLYDSGTGYITLIRHSEMGVQLQYWHQWSETYAFTIAGGVGFSRETQAPGADALLGEQSQRDLYQSWQFRLGADRIAKVGDRFQVYAGPGLHLWMGNIQLAHGYTITYKSSTTYRYGADGRIGVMVGWNKHWGMTGQISHYWGYTRALESGAETKQLSGGAVGTMGFYYSY